MNMPSILSWSSPACWSLPSTRQRRPGAVPAAGGKQPPGQRLRRNGPPGPGVVRGNPEERAASGRQPAQLRQLPSRPGPPGQLRAAVGGLPGLSGVPRQEQQGQYVRRAPAGLFPVQHERQGAGGRQPGDQGPDRHAYWLASQAPTGAACPDAAIRTWPAGSGYSIERGARSMPRSARSATAPTARARWLWGRRCSHRWGAQSFNWGAGMHRINTAASFIKYNMPLGKPGTLSDRDAWDVAAFMNSHERPQDPRLVEGSVRRRGRSSMPTTASTCTDRRSTACCWDRESDPRGLASAGRRRGPAEAGRRGEGG